MLLGLWAATWLTLLTHVTLSPPVDNVEQLTWVRSLQWGYYKHPPLPTFLLFPLMRLFGVHELVSYLLGAALTLASVAVSWHLVRQMSGRKVAFLATLGTLCITYYNGRLHYFNHNIVLLLLVCLAAYFCWQAFARDSLVRWAAVGLVLGLGAITKYQIVLAAGSVVVFWFTQRGWASKVHRVGIGLAALIALLVFLPHGLWLLSNDFLPVQYAMESSLGAHLAPAARIGGTLLWIADQLNRLVPALLLGALVLWPGRTTRRPAAADSCDKSVKVFLFSWGVLPLLIIAGCGLVSGAELQRQWGTAFMPLTCAWLMSLWGNERWSAVRTKLAMASFVAMQVLLIAINWATSPLGPTLTMKVHGRNFPSKQLADALSAEARQFVDGRVCVLAGPARLASVVALRMPEHPLVLLDGRLDFSPWVKSPLGEGCRTIWIGASGSDLPAGLHSPRPLPYGYLWSVDAAAARW